MASSHGAYGDSFQSPQSSQSPALIPEPSSSVRDRKKKQQQPRQLLSCTKCRERKVKCDRTKPCSACCARGQPKECHFVLGEGTEFGPIQQSLELRKLRSENQKLKERLLAAKVSLSDDSEEDDGSSTGRPGHISRRMANRQKRFRTGDHTDSLYFGSPGLANIISDFASMQVEPKSLAFTMPRGADMYAAKDSIYPFPTLWQATTLTQGLLQCLGSLETLLAHVDTFANKAVGFSFPFLPEELSHKEVENFVQDAEQNAGMYPDVLALIFAGSALGMQLSEEDADAHQRKDRIGRGDVLISAAMQALRVSAFMSRPTLRSLMTLLIIGPYLTNSGRFLDAWSLFGVTIRLAQSIGLHRNAKYLDPVPELKECTMRSKIWWWMLHTDQLYSMTLGRPLGISGIGDCPPAEPLTTNPAVLRLGEFVDQLTLLGRQILSSNQLTDAKIDLFTDRLISLWDTMPDTLQFNDSWSDPDTQLPEYPLSAITAVHYCKIQSYIILLNRQRVENARATPESSLPSPRSFQSVLPGQGLPDLTLPRPHLVPRGRPMVLQSSLELLDTFFYFYKRVPIALVDWTVGQQAFNACLILLLDALEMSDLQNIPKVEQSYAIFVQIDRDGVHQLAEMAVNRISEGLLRLRDVVEKGHGSTAALGKGRSIGQATNANRGSRGGLSGSRYFDESVMSGRSMFLLEDPGLQSRSVLKPAVASPGNDTVQSFHADQPALTPAIQSPVANVQTPSNNQHRMYLPQDGYHLQQVVGYQQPPSLNSTPLGYSNYSPTQGSQGSHYGVDFHPSLALRRDSVTAGSHAGTRMAGSSSPRIGPSFAPPSMQPPPPPPSGHYPAPMMYQQPQYLGSQPQQQPSQQQQQMSDQDWQTLRTQQMVHFQATQQRRQMYPQHRHDGQ